MTDSRNILIDVIFAEDSLTKISSADIREFVNYVYDELMNKENIADNLTNTSFSTALSAKQGTVLDTKIKKLKGLITNNNIEIQGCKVKNDHLEADLLTSKGDIFDINAKISNINNKSIFSLVNRVIELEDKHIALEKDLRNQIQVLRDTISNLPTP